MTTQIKNVNVNKSIFSYENREPLKVLISKGILNMGFPGDNYIRRDSYIYNENVRYCNSYNDFLDVSLNRSKDYDVSLTKYSSLPAVTRHANSAPMITNANIQATLGDLNQILAQSIETLTAIQVADLISKPMKIAPWGYQSVTVKIKENTGKVMIDDGSANDTIRSTTNYGNFTRGLFNVCGFWGNTDLERVTTGVILENIQADNVNSLMQNLSISRNLTFFFGAPEKNQNPNFKLYGLLNDPNLNDFTIVKEGSSSENPTYWKNKTPQEIYNDVIDAYNELSNLSGGIVPTGLSVGRGKLKFCYALGEEANLMQMSNVGYQLKTAKDFIKDNFGDKIEFIQVPQFNDAVFDSDVFYLIYEEDIQGPTIINGFGELARAYPILNQHDRLSQKITSSIAGCIVRIPMFIVRKYGIGSNQRTDGDSIYY